MSKENWEAWEEEDHFEKKKKKPHPDFKSNEDGFKKGFRSFNKKKPFFTSRSFK